MSLFKVCMLMIMVACVFMWLGYSVKPDCVVNDYTEEIPVEITECAVIQLSETTAKSKCITYQATLKKELEDGGNSQKRKQNTRF